MRVIQLELAALETADLAVSLVRAEGVVDETKPREHVVDGGGADIGVTDVDEDAHPHHVLAALKPGRRRRRHTRRALASATWSDSSNAVDVSVASEMMSIFVANCSSSTCCASSGMTFLLRLIVCVAPVFG